MAPTFIARSHKRSSRSTLDYSTEATRVLALGPVMKEHLERLGCPEKKIVIHPLGVDVENLPAQPRILKPGEPLRILFAGTFREKKGIQYLIEAASLAHRAGVRLAVRACWATRQVKGETKRLKRQCSGRSVALICKTW